MSFKNPNAHPDAVNFAADARRYLVYALAFASECLNDEPTTTASIHLMFQNFQEILWAVHPKVVAQNREYIENEIHAEFTKHCSEDDERPRSQFWLDYIIEMIEHHSKLFLNPDRKISPQIQLETDIKRYAKFRSTIADSLRLKGVTPRFIDFSCPMELRKPEIMSGFNKVYVDTKLKINALSDNLYEMWQGDCTRRIRAPLPYARKIALSVLSHLRSEAGNLGFRKVSLINSIMDRAFGDSILLLGPASWKYKASGWFRITQCIIRTIYEIFIEMYGEESRPYASNLAVALMGVMNEYYELDEKVLVICDYLPGASGNADRKDVCWNVVTAILGWPNDLTRFWFNKIPSDFKMN